MANYNSLEMIVQNACSDQPALQLGAVQAARYAVVPDLSAGFPLSCVLACLRFPPILFLFCPLILFLTFSPILFLSFPLILFLSSHSFPFSFLSLFSSYPCSLTLFPMLFLSSLFFFVFALPPVALYIFLLSPLLLSFLFPLPLLNSVLELLSTGSCCLLTGIRRSTTSSLPAFFQFS